ncbi:unnamed protein product [Cuscuta epithymum]|uniref:Uncharacterized protein n=1 Tax=Cuscuta epithymum TaxID=186058 RepID=A0AAV0F933_9ASTE|nr:unnamed protein product [Cuscuta epithymum]
MLDENSAEYDPQSQKFNLVPGDTIIALGRYNGEQNGLMVIAGEFSINLTGLDCPELFRAEFEIVRHGIGGPIINRYGEVIGITFYCASLTPFLPINLISLWWEQFKNKGQMYADVLYHLGLHAAYWQMGTSRAHKWLNSYLCMHLAAVGP